MLLKRDRPCFHRETEQARKEIGELSEKRDEMMARWQQEKQLIEDIRQLKQQIEEYKIQVDQLVREGQLAKASEIKYGKLVEAQQKLEELSKKSKRKRTSQDFCAKKYPTKI